MPIPCESTPRRSVRTMREAVSSAAGFGIFMATRASTMKAVSRAWVSRTGASGMVQPRDLEAGALELVPAVDGGEHGRDALERAGVGERPDVDHAQPHGTPQLGDRLLRGGLAADEEVAVDRMVRRGELVRGDVMEGGDDPRLGQERLRLLRRRAGGRWREEASPAKDERHDGRDDDLVTAAVARLGQGRGQAGVGQGDHDHLAEPRGLAQERLAALLARGPPETADDRRGYPVELAHDGLGGRGELVGEGEYRGLQRAARGVALAEVAAERGEAGDADRDVREPLAPRAAEGVGDDDADVRAAERAHALAEAARGAVGILGQERDRVGVHVGL